MLRGRDMANTPTGDRAAANIAADAATGTATDASAEQKVKPTALTAADGSTIEDHKDGDVWVEDVKDASAVSTSEEAEALKAQAREDEKLRIENPNQVVYRKSDAPI